jgi:hypothetical protein
MTRVINRKRSHTARPRILLSAYHWHAGFVDAQAEPPPCSGRAWALDLAFALGLGACALVISLALSGDFPHSFYFDDRAQDTWFEADQPRTLKELLNAEPDAHERTSVHPLFSMLATPMMLMLVSAGAPPIAAGRGLLALVGFSTTALLFFTLRSLTLPRPVAALFITTFLVSATYLHWFTIIETYAPAGLSTSAMLWVATSARRDQRGLWIASSAGTLAITVTNWMVGIAAAVCRQRLARALSISLVAFVLVAMLALVQRAVYPGSNLFFTPDVVYDELEFTQINDDGLEDWTPFTNLWCALVYPAVVPRPAVVDTSEPGYEGNRLISNQDAPLLSFSRSGRVALICWLLLVTLGIEGAWRARQWRGMTAMIGLVLGGQLALHSVYGFITFLYAANYFPAFVVLVACSWFSRARTAALWLAVILVATAAYSNSVERNVALAFEHSLLNEFSAQPTSGLQH